LSNYFEKNIKISRNVKSSLPIFTMAQKKLTKFFSTLFTGFYFYSMCKDQTHDYNSKCKNWELHVKQYIWAHYSLELIAYGKQIVMCGNWDVCGKNKE